MMKAPGNLKLHVTLSLVVTAIGLALMALKIYEDSEPGAIPLALVLLGSGWYFLTRRRIRART
jgi:hypothetical protein